VLVARAPVRAGPAILNANDNGLMMNIKNAFNVISGAFEGETELLDTRLILTSLVIIEEALQRDATTFKGSLRKALPDLQSSPSVGRFCSALSNLIADRVSPELMIQDEGDEEYELHRQALTLTSTALTSAVIYASILSYKGALGSGYVQVAVTSQLLALVRRWRQECVQVNLCDEGDADRSSAIGVSPSSVSAHRRLSSGLKILKMLSQAVMHSEFSHWTVDSQEHVVECISLSLSTVAALAMISESHEFVEKARATKQAVLEALNRECVGDNTELRKTFVSTFLRNIFPALIMSEPLPCKSKGKIAGHESGREAILIMLRSHEATSCISSKEEKENSETNPAFSDCCEQTKRTVPTLDTSTKPVLCVLQKVAVHQSLDNSEVRERCVSTVVECLDAVGIDGRRDYISFLTLVCASRLSINRLVGTAILGRLLVRTWTWETVVNFDNSKISDQPSPFSSKLSLGSDILVTGLLDRLLDRTPATRCCAIAAITKIINEVSSSPTSTWKEHAIACFECNGGLVFGALRSLLQDEKALVRRSAVEASLAFMTASCFHSCLPNFVDSDLDCLQAMSRDPSKLVSRATVTAMTKLLEAASFPSSIFELIATSWAYCIVQIAFNGDTGCATHASQLIYQNVLQPFSEQYGSKTNKIVKRVYFVIVKISEALSARGSIDTQARMFARCAFDGLPLDTKTQILKNIASSCRAGSEFGSWFCLLSIIHALGKESIQIFVSGKENRVLFDFSFLYDNKDLPAALFSSQVVRLYLLARVADYFSHEVRQKMVAVLSQVLITFDITVCQVDAVLCIFCESQKHSEALRPFIESVYGASLKLSKTLSSHHEMNETEVGRLATMFYICGELSMVGFHKSMKASKSHQEMGPPISLINVMRACIPKFLPGRSTVTPDRIRAHAIIAIGKLCLQMESTAKSTLNILANEIQLSHEDKNWNIQCNSLVVFGDLSMTYTGDVERYVPMMSTCLQAGVSQYGQSDIPTDDGSENVREQAVLVLSNLLLQDYIKMRGLLFHRLFVCQIDANEEVSGAAEKMLYGPLLSRYPSLLVENFMEAVFVLNNCKTHSRYVAAASARDNGLGTCVNMDGIVLSGPKGASRRIHLYRASLSRFRDEQKIELVCRLVQDVFEDALVPDSELNQACKDSATFVEFGNVLLDVFAILGLPEMQIRRPLGAANSEEASLVARNRLVGLISQRHFVEILIPTILRFKTMLQKHNSHLLKALTVYLISVYKRYRKQIRSAFVNDPVLLTELEYDTRSSGEDSDNDPTAA